MVPHKLLPIGASINRGIKNGLPTLTVVTVKKITARAANTAMIRANTDESFI